VHSQGLQSCTRPRTRYLDDYNLKLEQYDQDLEAYNAAAAAIEAAAGQAAAGQEAAGQRGRAPVRPALPKKPDETLILRVLVKENPLRSACATMIALGRSI
jgi:hypothetical protein